MGIDRQDDADGDECDVPAPPADAPDHQPENNTSGTERVPGYRANVDAAYRQHAIDQGCARVEQIERDTVTPAMRRIEAADPDRSLVGLDHRLKGKDRLTEKVEFDMKKWGVTAEQAFRNVKDAIRYTFQYPEDKYADGVCTDIDRLKSDGFELVECRNLWDCAEYKGINSRWRVVGVNQLFEVQFHTQASFDAKQETHEAYERLRSLPEDHEDVHELRAYQREVTSKIPDTPGALDIPSYP
jgi:hypothetical protein